MSLSIKSNGSMGASGIILGTSNFPKKISKFILSKLNRNKTYNISKNPTIINI